MLQSTHESVRSLVRTAYVGDVDAARERAASLEPAARAAVLGVLAQIQKDEDGAVRILFDPQLPAREPLLDKYRAAALEASGRPRDAARMLARMPIQYSPVEEAWTALHHQPSDAESWVEGLGGEEAGEIRTISRALRGDAASLSTLGTLAADSATAAIGLAWALKGRGAFDEAFAVLREASRRFPQRVALYTSLADLKIVAGDPEGARASVGSLPEEVRSAVGVRKWKALFDCARALPGADAEAEELLALYPESPLLAAAYARWSVRNLKPVRAFKVVVERAKAERALGLDRYW